MKWVFLVSVAMFLGALVLVPLIVVRLPDDYFARPRREPARIWSRYPWLRWGWLIGRTLFGLTLVFTGIAMLVLPGQGILTILVGIGIMEFPGKYRLERWVLTRRPLMNAVNRLRRSCHRPPLKLRLDGATGPSSDPH